VGEKAAGVDWAREGLLRFEVQGLGGGRREEGEVNEAGIRGDERVTISN
jgi:hypothetical protein